MVNYVVEQKNHILMERPEPSFYAKIPKMAQLDLDPYELALYSNYKQTASDNPNGGAWKSNETLAKECQMSPRKITQVRQSLVSKGFIHCQYETSESGKEYSAAIVTIVDIWQENHERFTKSPIAQGANRIAFGAIPPLHDVLSPIAQGANKEELSSKNLKKELFPELVAMEALVKKELKQYTKSTITKMAMLLMGLCSGKDADLNLARAITEAEFLAFLAWWDKKKDRDGNRLARPSNIGSIRRNVQTWLDEQDTQASQISIVVDNMPSNRMTAAQAMAMLSQEIHHANE